MSDLDKKIDEIVVRIHLGEKLWEQYKDNPLVVVKVAEDYKPLRAKDSIKQLISEEVRKARIDELRSLKSDMLYSDSQFHAIDDRVDELNEQGES